nr:unnamed protein product [Callosobruchus chinensis]
MNYSLVSKYYLGSQNIISEAMYIYLIHYGLLISVVYYTTSIILKKFFSNSFINSLKNKPISKLIQLGGAENWLNCYLNSSRLDGDDNLVRFSVMLADLPSDLTTVVGDETLLSGHQLNTKHRLEAGSNQVVLVKLRVAADQADDGMGYLKVTKTFSLSRATLFRSVKGRDLEYPVAVKNNIKNQFLDRFAERCWLKGFFRRHHDMLSVRQPTRSTHAQANGFSKKNE